MQKNLMEAEKLDFRVQTHKEIPVLTMEEERHLLENKKGDEGRMLKYVPKSQKTTKLCIEALKQNAYVLRYVPTSLKKEVKNSIKN